MSKSKPATSKDLMEEMGLEVDAFKAAARVRLDAFDMRLERIEGDVNALIALRNDPW